MLTFSVTFIILTFTGHSVNIGLLLATSLLSSERNDSVTEHSPGPSVCLSVRKVYCGKTADWIRMPFGVVSGAGRGMGVLDGDGYRRRERGSFGGEFGASIVTNGAFATRLFSITLRTC